MAKIRLTEGQLKKIIREAVEGVFPNMNSIEPKFKVGDIMRTIEEAEKGWKDGMPFVVAIKDGYYYCNNEKIPVSQQDEYEYPPMGNVEV